jgi:hypothetical protein
MHLRFLPQENVVAVVARLNLFSLAREVDPSAKSEPITLITDYASPTSVSFPWRFEGIDDAVISRGIVDRVAAHEQ